MLNKEKVNHSPWDLEQENTSTFKTFIHHGARSPH